MTARNDACTCGSGKRYKQCCGALSQPRLRDLALAEQRAGNLRRAEELYRQALLATPADFDARHMLGVVLLQRMRYLQALRELREAARLAQWKPPEVRHNLGLAIAHLLGRQASARSHVLLQMSAESRAAIDAVSVVAHPLVSVILPSYNHARFVAAALGSVFAQTYSQLELIVIDDGSSDDSVACINACLAATSIPARFLARENRGAAATLNEGAGLARGDYLAFLNSDDCYEPQRIARLVESVARRGKDWGFSRVAFIDAEGASLGAKANRAAQYQQEVRQTLGRWPLGMALAKFNFAFSTGNLFLRRSLFERLGGFREYRYNHDWDFCLRACREAEPVLVDEVLYQYRLHERNTIAEGVGKTHGESDRALGGIYREVLGQQAQGPNPLSIWRAENRHAWLEIALRSGQGALFEGRMLDALASELLAAASAAEPEISMAPPLRHDADRKLAAMAVTESGPSPGVPSASFVLCIENNGIRDQALLLCESIRRYAGKYADSPILAFSPRKGLAVDHETRARLRELKVDYIDEPLNQLCPEYGSANRVVAAAWAEARVGSDYLIVLDSDTLFLSEPVIPEDADAAVRPEDTKGCGSAGPGDPFEAYWQALANLAGCDLGMLPWIRTAVDGYRQRAEYNGGLVMARRAAGLLEAWRELFARSIEAGLRPSPGSRASITASTGEVGGGAAELWGSNQAALAVALWCRSRSVSHLPASYNLPLHLLAKELRLDSEWTAARPVHVHYHWMLAPDYRDVALDLLGRLGVAPEQRDWIARRAAAGYFGKGTGAG